MGGGDATRSPAPHSQAGPGFWLLGKAAGGVEGQNGEQAGRGFGSADLVASVWAFSAVSSSLRLFSFYFFWFRFFFFPLPFTGVHLGDPTDLSIYVESCSWK